MKKRVAILLVLGMAISLCACEQKENKEPVSAPVQNTEQEANIQADTEQKADKQVVADTETEANTETDAETNNTQADASVDIITLSPDKEIDYEGKQLLLSMANEDENGGGNITLKYGDAEYELSEYAEWNSDAFAWKIDDTSFYVALQPCYSNDWVNTYIVKYDGTSFKDVVNHEGSFADISGDVITFSTRKDVLGTYGVLVPMKFLNDTLEDVSDEIVFINEANPGLLASFDDSDENDFVKMTYDEEGYRVLTLKQPLKAADSNGSEIEIQKGEQIRPYSFNPKESIFFFTYKNEKYQFKYERIENDYTYTVDGVDQEELFEIVPYAG